jgi:cardiolipin synthase
VNKAKVNKSKISNKVSGTLRAFLVAAAVGVQLFILWFFAEKLRETWTVLYFLLQVLALFEAYTLVKKNRSSAYTIAWLIIILLSPVFGYLLYRLWGRSSTHSTKSEKMASIVERSSEYMPQDGRVQKQFEAEHPALVRHSTYLQREGFPIYAGTASRYYPLGEDQYAAMIEDLKAAERFIFLEYFILSEGRLWDEIHGILREKAVQGLEIRLLFDDFGSMATAPRKLIQTLKAENIKAHAFNPVHKSISRLFLNYRNHQKIVVIDGDIGYTGGTNLADEYANIIDRFGHWKDTGIRLEGDAVWGLTVTFLQMWESETNAPEDYNAFRPTKSGKGDGYFQPFSDGPVNNPQNPAEAMYRQLICSAKEYLWITTPYLIIDNAMTDALCLAAQSGVDVRIVTPKVWDHWYVHMVTRSNYAELIEAGVRIYEYTPGYIHAKTIISDGESAIIGSINMDYRSFHLHFENGVWISGSEVLCDIENDLTDVFGASELITLKELKKTPWRIRFVQSLLRILAPLM